MLPTWLGTTASRRHVAGGCREEPAVRAEVQRAIDIANKNVSRAESIRKFTILDTSGPRRADTSRRS
jgi:long-chain acyl-CoA synthetase